MKYTYKKIAGFTLIELLITITIFGVIMISVLSIFMFSSQMSTRVEISRVMQENIKNVTQDITENIRLKGLSGVLADKGVDSCDSGSGSSLEGTKLCLTGGIEYTIGNETGSGSIWERVNDISYCQQVDSNCHIIKRDSPTQDYYPLTNSFSHFENISFTITNSDVPKLDLHMSVRPSMQKSIASEVAKNALTHVQTTISERLITTQ